MEATSPQGRASSISYRQLKLFESIGRLKSVRRASEECNLSQPAVTQALAKLEQQVGARLLDRRACGSYLNELGGIFYGRTSRFFDQLEQAVLDLGAASSPAGANLIVKRLSRSQVRSLVAVAESGSFGQAAQLLNISQTSLQRAARDLEGNVRKPLYYRTAAGVMVTPAGVEFARKMKLAGQEIELGIEEIGVAEGRCSSQIVIGAMPSGGSVLLASVLDDFVRAYPQADVRIINDGASEMLKKLRGGDVDFVIGLLPEELAQDLVSEDLAQTPYLIVTRRGHSLLRKGKVSVEDLAKYDWVVGTAGASRRACFDRLFADRPGPRAPIATCALPVIRHLLTQSDRLTLMTSYELMHADNNLAAVHFDAIEPVPSIGITMRANWLPTQMHKDFIALVRAHMASAKVQPVLRRVS